MLSARLLDETFLAHLLVVDLCLGIEGGVAGIRRIHYARWWALDVPMGKIQSLSARSLVGELCSRRPIAHRAVAHGTRPGREDYLLIYKQGYLDRAKQENQDLISLIDSVREKFNLNLVWFHAGSEVIHYLNHGQPRDQVKIADLEYFGHSNRACFMFDYSNNIDSACKSWLHEDELTQINRRDFARGAYVKSWGCHTGESMSKKWRAATGTHMIGAIGKTQFMMEELPILTSADGKWVN